MIIKTVSTTNDWREMEHRAGALVPTDISDQIPMRITDGGRAVRFRNSNINLASFIASLRDSESTDDLATSFPSLNREDMRAVVDYYHSRAGSWVDEYVDLIATAAPLWHEEFKRRYDAGEYGSHSSIDQDSGGSSE